MRQFQIYSLIGLILLSLTSIAGTDGSISGAVTDSQGVAIAGATIKAMSSEGRIVKQTTSSMTGEFALFPLTFGSYDLTVESPQSSPYKISVAVGSGASTSIQIQLQPKEMLVEVKAKKHLMQNSASTSSTEISQEQIKTLPQGSEISLPKLLTSTTPGVIAGPFGQMFFRGNHANIQYQIDGIQLPDSPSNTFGQAFSPRNIDHMEVITGGIPSEYGERLASVVNIVTKSGPENPGGEVELNYGSYNTYSPHLLYGGSNTSGNVHYFFSANYNQTDRGLETPQPAADGGSTGTGVIQNQGSAAAIHDAAFGNSEFAKIDWFLNNEDKLTFIVFNAYSNYQIPNYPANFLFSDAYFQPGYSDAFGNVNSPTPTFNWAPWNTNDTQAEQNLYSEVVWKHTFSEKSFLQLATYWKYSRIQVGNDFMNDLTTGILSSPYYIAGATPSTFTEDKNVNNVGIKADYTNRPNDQHLLKAGLQLQTANAQGGIMVDTTDGAGNIKTPSFDSNADIGNFESVYIQDDYSLSPSWVLNLGLRFDATQFQFAGVSPQDSLLQPRIGINYLINDSTKIHFFYGKLFMPAPVEDLRDTFISIGGGVLAPYDIKAEKDDYAEIGVAHQAGSQLIALNIYDKQATNMLDDAQLLNTSIAQPYNFANGFAYGAELSVKGQINDNWSDYFNYSYEIAQGESMSGGLFTGIPVSSTYQFLDHVQVHTANTGFTYLKGQYWFTVEELYGSGLRTGPNNSMSLPSHLSTDLTAGYQFTGENWLSKLKVSMDALNVFNNIYPVTVANGFNGSHYAAGQQFFLRVSGGL